MNSFRIETKADKESSWNFVTVSNILAENFKGTICKKYLLFYKSDFKSEVKIKTNNKSKAKTFVAEKSIRLQK